MGRQTGPCSVAERAMFKTKRYRVLRGRTRKIKLIELHGGKCKRCHQSFPPYVYDFHHKNPTTKKFEVNTLALSGRTWEACEEEARGCELLCANCHRITEWEGKK